MKLNILSEKYKGGPGSGDFGHRGRPGKVGGSSDRALRRGIAPDAETYTRGPGYEEINNFFNKDLQDYSAAYGEFGEMYEEFTNYPGPNWETSSDNVRASVKRDIVNTLQYEPYSIDKDLSANILSSWASSSNDSDIHSLSLQQAISEEFDVPLSDWQQKKIENLQQNYGDFYNAGTTGYTPDQYRNAVRSIYENTQKQLQEAGFSATDMVRVYRGIKFKDYEDPKLTKGESYEWGGNVVESWSFDNYTARNFAGLKLKIRKSYVLSMDIPISSIFSTAKTGPGCLSEAELLIFGSIGNEVLVEDVY